MKRLPYYQWTVLVFCSPLPFLYENYYTNIWFYTLVFALPLLALTTRMFLTGAALSMAVSFSLAAMFPEPFSALHSSSFEAWVIAAFLFLMFVMFQFFVYLCKLLFITVLDHHRRLV
jgi:hypothetical protein